jgi:acyl-homoserine lactone acylase PvdQ
MRRAIPLLMVLFLAAPATAQNIIKLPGMKIGGTITRDSNGIPQITGFTEWDLHFLTGYVHAQDRLFQMDYLRRQASGTLAELVGSAALSSDVQLRAIGLRRAANTAINVISKEGRAAIEAYAMGVNAWALNNPLPPEYAALELTKFEPWTPIDSLAFQNIFLLGQFFDQSDADRTTALLTYQGTGAALGFDGTKLFFEDIFRFAPFDKTTTLPASARTGENAEEGAPSEGSEAAPAEPIPYDSYAVAAQALADSGALSLLEDWRNKLENAPYFKEALNLDRDKGSNEWGVTAGKSATGNPLVANDPHLSLGIPATWYPMSLLGGPINATGMGAAGAPLILVGHTPGVAWGATNNPTDVTDMYIEQVVPDAGSPSGLSTIYKGQREAIIPVVETFRVNNVGDGIKDNITVVPSSASIPPATLVVPRRNFGPIVSLDLTTGQAVSIQYTGFSPSRELDGFRIWNTSNNLADFQRGMQYLSVGSFNWAVADTAGNLAYLTSGEQPLREDLEAGAPNGLPPYFLRSGAGGNEWLPRKTVGNFQAVPYEILPAAERPQSVNPAAGYFVNSNNDPVGVTLGNNPLGRKRATGGIYYLNYGYDGFRCARITQVMKAKLAAGKISVADMKAMQADNVMIDAQVFTPFITAAFANAAVPASTTTFTGTLSGPNEFPPVASAGTGSTIVAYDAGTHLLTVNVTFSGLNSNTTASHIHCCVLPSAATPTAGVATTTPTFAGFPLGVTAGTYNGTLDLTQASSYNPAFVTANGGTVASAEAVLVSGIKSGMAYLNVHSTTSPGGEIRSFLSPLGPDPKLAAFAADPGVTAAVARLKTWDFSTPTGLTEGYDAGKPAGVAPTQAQIDASVAATIYSVWRGRFLSNVVDATLSALHLPLPGNDQNASLPALRNMLDVFPAQKGVGASGLNFFNVPGVTKAEDRRDILLLKSLSDALALLSSDAFSAAFAKSTNLADYRWGKLHRIVFRHPLGEPFNVPSAAASPFPGLPGYPRSGGVGTPDVANHGIRANTVNGFMFSSGPSRRYVGEATPTGLVGQTSLPGGVSGVPGSPLYFNLLPMWLTNQTYPAVLLTGPKLPWLN